MRQDLDLCGRGNDGLEGEKPPELERYRGASANRRQFPERKCGRRGPGRIESKTFLARMFANNFIDGEKREGE